MINIWSENSQCVENSVIVKQSKDMFDGITTKLKSHSEFYDDESKLIAKDNSCNVVINTQQPIPLEPTNNNVLKNPKTGDNILMYILFSSISFISIVALLILKK